jgi:hypothetical protein
MSAEGKPKEFDFLKNLVSLYPFDCIENLIFDLWSVVSTLAQSLPIRVKNTRSAQRSFEKWGWKHLYIQGVRQVLLLALRMLRR